MQVLQLQKSYGYFFLYKLIIIQINVFQKKTKHSIVDHTEKA